MKEERNRGGVYDIDTHTISGIDAYEPGYIDKDKEQIVGLQTAAPLTRAIMPFGGIRMVRNSLEAYGRKMDPEMEKVFQYRKTHNDGVFDVYTPQMRAARKSGDYHRASRRLWSRTDHWGLPPRCPVRCGYAYPGKTAV